MGGLVPFYEYRRPDGTILEVMQKMSDPPLTEDPETGVPLQRVFHPIAVHFKGKGFYNTDYGTKNRQREKAADESAKKSSDEAAKKSESSSSDSSSGDSSSSSTSDAKPTVEKKASESKAVKKLNEAKSAAKK
jgi:predicted nucleic acid-binding Zn ribbon protein